VASDYYIATFETNKRPSRWSWEICRHSKRMGVRITADGFRSRMAAEYAGARALADFLNLLVKEERRDRSRPRPKSGNQKA
jgi:hypothetical protein